MQGGRRVGRVNSCGAAGPAIQGQAARSLRPGAAREPGSGQCVRSAAVNASMSPTTTSRMQVPSLHGRRFSEFIATKMHGPSCSSHAGSKPLQLPATWRRLITQIASTPSRRMSPSSSPLYGDSAVAQRYARNCLATVRCAIPCSFGLVQRHPRRLDTQLNPPAHRRPGSPRR